MNSTLPDTAIATSGADSAATQPFPNSRKVYLTGSRPDIRVPMREISLADTPTDFGGEANAHGGAEAGRAGRHEERLESLDCGEHLDRQREEDRE